ncbi:hypothetical protein [Caulobacter sp. FWC2]|uniref:hypothetical protein n=1 Tax=Caulobacter sp. FWC2 TaxID=69664 RepID=UPI000C159342|nr:hypothetical protein [Caulobacter sp. FWC2]PIB92466.1 hypothetical protein CSW62_13365 [Caulobacter sp. FWC2]
MLETVSADPAQAAPIPAPAAPEGADLLVRARPHDQAFWDRHPQVATYKVTMKAGEADLALWDVLVWLKPGVAPAQETVPVNHAIPARQADATFIAHAAHDLGFFASHPDLAAWRVSLGLNPEGPGAVHEIEVWMATPA